MRASHLFTAAFAFSSLSSATWLDTLGENKALAGLEGLLHRRQDEGSASSAASSAQVKSTASAAASATASASAAASKSADEENKTDEASASVTGKTTQKATATTGTNKGTITGTKSKTSSIDARLPAGGISMITPAALAGQQYYKIGDWVTFAWNYTSLIVTPTAIDILASCAKNSATYTLAVNQTIEATGRILWDTSNVEASNTAPLIQETYTLMVLDADSSVSATARPGYLGNANQFYFGMYSPRPYTPWADFKCPGCSGAGALSATERQTLGFLCIMTTITILSFSWFANGFGIF